KVSYINKELTLKNSAVNERRAILVRFIDPNGMDIFIYHWVGDDYGEGVWKKGHYNKETGALLEAFAKTKVGYTFLSKYAKAGQKIGSIEFKTDGIYHKQNLNFYEFKTRGAASGARIIENKDNLNFNIQLNTVSLDNPGGKESYYVTIGHETLIHIDQVDDNLIEAFHNNKAKFRSLMEKQKENEYNRGDFDHKKYINGDKNYNSFNLYIKQLQKLVNPNLIQKAREKHDENYQKFRKK
ncbi:MAG: hypothetical protein Q4G63_13020, partial [Bacteroidia bacterium]|nr:hypothetical protein [Bacteroidia bacterium]